MITIIVLLILAGVSISMLTGENGLLTRADIAKEEVEIVEVIEKAKIEIFGVQAQKKRELTNSEINEIIEKYDKEKKIRNDKEEKYIVTEKGYEIKVSDIWNGTLITEKKTIDELYDGCNNPADANYNENAMHIGDYVNYTAGIWNETNSAPVIPTRGTPSRFGGYSVGQSRDEDARGSISYNGSIITYERRKI